MKVRYLLCLIISLLAGAVTTARAESWPCWRGPRGDGTCVEKGVPTNWDPAGALWKTGLPGKGHASPIVWGGRVFTVTALPLTKERLLLCLDRNTGSIFWQRTVVQGPLEKLHKENSYASGTPATDGERIYVTFRVGDEIVVAVHDFASGEQLWLVRPGTHVGEWGFSNEPVLYKAATGEVFWQEKLGRHYASPVLADGLAFLINDDGEVNVIKPGVEFNLVAKYELGESCYASPAISDGQVFLRGFKHLFCIGKKVN